MKKWLPPPLVVLCCTVLPFFFIHRVLDDVQCFAQPILPPEALTLTVGICLAFCQGRRVWHPLTLLPALTLLAIAALTLRCPMDYSAMNNSGYIEGAHTGIGAWRDQPGLFPLVYLFVLDDHITLYGLLSQLLLGLTGGAMVLALLCRKQARFAWKPCLALVGLAIAALALDGGCAWASTRVFADNWFGLTMSRCSAITA